MSSNEGSRYPKIDSSGLKMVSGADRSSKVNLNMMGKPVGGDVNFGEFLGSLPDVLKVKELRELDVGLNEIQIPYRLYREIIARAEELSEEEEEEEDL